jgi:uncharacterized protein (TIGR03437 family)
MPRERKPDLDRRLNGRLDAYFAELRARPLRETLKRRAANWQVYAAVTGSAMAMATGASAAIIGSGARGILAAEAVASVLAAGPLANPRNNRLNAVKSAATGQAPSIAPAGVVPLCSNVNTIQAGEWVTIYGANLANVTASWNGDFPLSLGGTSVTINGRSAYLMYVSPGQINLQAPDDMALGTVAVVVTTGAGSATSYVTLDQFAPSFSLLDSKHVSGIILRADHSGAYGAGTYDLLGPTGKSLGYPTVAAKAGDNIELFAVGLGPTTPTVPAGQVYSGAAPIDNNLSLYINGAFVKPTFVGLSSAGIYQINLTIPSGGLGQGDVPIFAMIGGLQTQPGIVISVQNSFVGGGGGTVGTGGGGGTFVPPGPIFFSGGTGFGGTGGGTGGGSGGGSGGGGSDRKHRRKPYDPKLKFPPK